MHLHSNIVGKGRTVIILHGLFGMSDNWLSIAKGLAQEGFEVHLLDLRNHGRSPHMPSHRYIDMCNDLVDYINRENLIQVDVVGHSMGGKVAMYVALLHPTKLRKMVVIDIDPVEYTFPGLEDHVRIIYHLLEMDLSVHENLRSIQEEINTRVGDSTLALFLTKNIRRDSSNKFRWKLNLPVILDFLPTLSLGLEDLQANAPSPVRSLFIRGEQSDYISDKNRSVRNIYFPASTVVTIKNAGHWVHVDQPDTVLHFIVNFL